MENYWRELRFRVKNIYIKKSLEKFYENKSYKYFPGCSIVKNFDDEILIETITDIRNEMIESKLFDNYVFLKPSSYHMTVCDLYTYDTNKIINFDEIEMKDKEVLSKLSKINYNLNVEMEMFDISDKKILLRPKTNNSKHTLNVFRDNVYTSLGIKNDENYVFHISLTYKIEENEQIKTEKIKDFMKKLTNKYREKLQRIMIDKPVLTVFNDMSEFRDINLGRKNLGLTNYDNLK